MADDQKELDFDRREEQMPPIQEGGTIPTPNETLITARHEKALRYLEQKRVSERTTIHEMATVRLESVAELQLAPPVVTMSQPDQALKDRVAGGRVLTQPKRVSSALMSKQRFPLVVVETVQTRRYKHRRQLLLRHLARKYIRNARSHDQRTFHRFWFTLGGAIMALFVVILSVTGAGAFAAYNFYNDTHNKFIPQVLTLKDLLPRDNLKMYDRNGVMIAQLTDQGLHTAVSYDQISQHTINATVAVEDKNFWNNPGIDVLRIIQAAIDNLNSGRVVEGGSTITQQLIKNLVVGNETSVVRKLQEVALTPALNTHYSKQDILEMYLNSIYYGHQAYGINAAASVYFGLEDKPDKPAAMQLSLAQAAMLAGIPSSPSANDPFVNFDGALNRFHQVLTSLRNQGYITKVDMIDAIKEVEKKDFLKQPKNLTNRAPHFSNFVLKQLQEIFHLKREQLSRSDMQVYTTLDVALQDKIQKIAQQHIATLRDSHNVSNSASVLIDYRTGAIISLLGSIDYNSKEIDGQFDVATLGYRQPGSSFKPYVYVTAFEQGISPAQAVNDAPLTIRIPGSTPPVFSPKNYDLRFHGHMTLRCALQNSLNIPAVKVLQHVGIDEAMSTAKDMGIGSYEGVPGYSLVLGGLGVRLLDHTSAFGTFANGGERKPYYAVQEVRFGNSTMTYTHPDEPGKRVISPQLAYMMTNILSDNSARLPQFYDCNLLQLYANTQRSCWAGNRGVVRPAAVKTGTTTDFRDNWTVGYTMDYIMGVWVGNNDNSPMIGVTGVAGAAPIWHEAMLLASKDKPIRDFSFPGGLVKATVTYPDGVKATDWFIPGTVPSFTLPTPTPTQQPTPEVTPTPDATLVPNQTQNENQPEEPAASSYCPTSYSFAMRPPPARVQSGPGWW